MTLLSVREPSGEIVGCAYAVIHLNPSIIMV